MYPIDLRTILRVLAQQSGELHANVRVENVRGQCEARVSLLQGNIVSCEVRQKGRVIFAGDEAFRFLLQRGVLEWKYIPAPSSSSQTISRNESRNLPPQPSNPALPSVFPMQEHMVMAAFPVRARPISPQEISSWPLPLRSVYKLSTGEKSVQEIALLLSIPPDRLRAIIQELMRLNAVSLSPRPIQA